MTPSGVLKHRVTIQNPTDETKSDGLPNPWAEPTTFATVWASIEPQSSGESFENNQVVTTITHKVTIRTCRESTTRNVSPFEAATSTSTRWSTRTKPTTCWSCSVVRLNDNPYLFVSSSSKIGR